MKDHNTFVPDASKAKELFKKRFGSWLNKFKSEYKKFVETEKVLSFDQFLYFNDKAFASAVNVLDDCLNSWDGLDIYTPNEKELPNRLHFLDSALGTRGEFKKNGAKRGQEWWNGAGLSTVKKDASINVITAVMQALGHVDRFGILKGV